MSFLEATGQVIGFLILSIIAIIESIVKTFIPAKYKMKSVAGEIALVTGGGGGLGSLIALRLANLGAIVVVWDINKNAIDDTVKLIQAAGGTCYGYVCNLCDREDVYRKAALVKEEVGKVSILVNNAGVAHGMRLLDTPDQVIIRTMDVNVMSHFWTAKAFLPSMMENNKGHIVSIASMAGQVGVPKLVDYCASKFAAVGLDEALCIELQSEGYNIQTTIVCPYFITSTGMFEGVQTRFLPKLTSNEVAECVITAMRCNQKIAVLPRYFRILMAAKWIFPWTVIMMFLRGLVVDVAPHLNQSPNATRKEDVSPVVLSKEQPNIHHQLARRISSSERKP